MNLQKYTLAILMLFSMNAKSVTQTEVLNSATETANYVWQNCNDLWVLAGKLLGSIDI